jgi:hypothetical protein
MQGFIVDNTDYGSPGDRRSADRFPIVREVRYKLLSGRDFIETGGGETVNISSSGILFTTERELQEGRRLEISVSWPARLDDKCNLKLVAKGRVIRSEQGQTAMSIEKYEFRTRAQNSFVAGNGF